MPRVYNQPAVVELLDEHGASLDIKVGLSTRRPSKRPPLDAPGLQSTVDKLLDEHSLLSNSNSILHHVVQAIKASLAPHEAAAITFIVPLRVEVDYS